jgi:23S rRNA (pseudouridine1915-N3)-methyltransferase
MKIQLYAVGKSHESYVKEGVELFTKRLQHYYPTEWKIIPPPRNAAQLSVEQLKKAEGEIILNQVQKDDMLVALDERGKQLTNEKLAELIQSAANKSHKNLIFLIGGAYGISSDVLKRANFTWSLSSLVFPHQLVRLILAEQVYRACTILRNEKYHH